MTQHTESGKKAGKRPLFKKVLCSILILILAIIVSAAALYIYLKIAKTTQDDVAALTSAEMMSASERYSFDASSLKMEINIDKSDLWWLLKEVNFEDKIAELSDNLKRNGFTLQSYGLDITDKGILMSAEITYGKFLRLPIKMLTKTTVKDGTLIITPARVYLGKIGLSLNKFPLNRLAEGFGIDPDRDLDQYAFEIPLSDYELMSMLSNVYFKDSRMVMVYKLDESLFSGPINAYNEGHGWFATEYTDYMEVLREYKTKGSLGEKFTSLVEGFASDPGSFPDFMAKTLALSSESDFKEYLNENGPWLARFMPEITEKSVSDANASLYKLFVERSALFNKLLDTLVAPYDSLKFGIDASGLKYNNKPFALESFMGEAWGQYASWIDASSFRPVLVDTLTAYDAKTPMLRKITNSTEYIDKVDSLNKKYPMGFIVKMHDGTPVLKYLDVAIKGKQNKPVTIYQTVVLDNATYEAMMKNPLLPVWRE